MALHRIQKENVGIRIGGGGDVSAFPSLDSTTSKKKKKQKRDREVEEKKTDSDAEPSVKKKGVLQSRDQEILIVTKNQETRVKRSSSSFSHFVLLSFLKFELLRQISIKILLEMPNKLLFSVFFCFWKCLVPNLLENLGILERQNLVCQFYLGSFCDYLSYMTGRHRFR